MTSLALVSASLSDPATTALLTALRDAFGPDGAVLASFTLSDARLPDCLVQHTLEGSRFDLSRLVLTGALRHHAPALTDHVDPDRLYGFELLNPLHLGAAIGEALAAGGPSPAHRCSAGAAFALASAWVEVLTEGTFEEAVVLHSRAAWSDWFGCEVWDRTWVIGYRASGRVTLLCLTGRTTGWRPRLRQSGSPVHPR